MYLCDCHFKVFLCDMNSSFPQSIHACFCTNTLQQGNEITGNYTCTVKLFWKTTVLYVHFTVPAVLQELLVTLYRQSGCCVEQNINSFIISRVLFVIPKTKLVSAIIMPQDPQFLTVEHAHPNLHLDTCTSYYKS